MLKVVSPNIQNKQFCVGRCLKVENEWRLGSEWIGGTPVRNKVIQADICTFDINIDSVVVVNVVAIQYACVHTFIDAKYLEIGSVVG